VAAGSAGRFFKEPPLEQPKLDARQKRAFSFFPKTHSDLRSVVLFLFHSSGLCAAMEVKEANRES
jgi:hypothetical protein